MGRVKAVLDLANLVIGRPLGDDRFLARIEQTTKRRLKAGKRGPKPKASTDGAPGDLLNALSP